MIRARLINGDLTTYIGNDPNGGYVIRHEDGTFGTVQEFTPEFGPIRHMWITGIYQGAGELGIASWPTRDIAHDYQQKQLTTLGNLVPLGQVMAHDGLVILADSTGVPLEGQQ